MRMGKTPEVKPETSGGETVKTKRVRIAVQIAADGEWCASGSSEPKWEHVKWVKDTLDCITNLQSKANSLHWVEAEVPIPDDTKEIECEVAP